MQKFVALISTPPETTKQWMEMTDEATRKEQVGKMMADWQDWQDAHAANIVDAGMPLGKTKKVTSDGVTDSQNDLNFMMVVQAESADAAAALFTDNPHLRDIPGSYVQVMGTSDPKPE